MSVIHTLKSSFNSGELSPMLDARVDSEKYASGCKELTNFIPTVYGGIKKRPGTQLVGFTKNDAPARLHGFKRNSDSNYILEFGERYVRFWKGGAQPKRVALVGNDAFDEWVGTNTFVQWNHRLFFPGHFVKHNGVDYICRNGHDGTNQPNTEPGIGSQWTSYWYAFSGVAPWVAGMLYYPGWSASVDGRGFVCLVNHNSGTSSRPVSGANYTTYWAELTSPHVFVWDIERNFIPGDQLKARVSNVIYRCTGAHNSAAATEPGVGEDWSIYWKRVEEFEIGMNVKQGGHFYVCQERHYPSTTFAADSAYWAELEQSEGPGLLGYEVGTPYLATEVFDLQFTQLNDVLFIAHPNHHPKRLSRHGEAKWVFEDVPFQYAPSLDVNEDRTSVQIQFDDLPSYVPAWAAATNYNAGDRVTGPTTANGRFFECLQDHASGTTSSTTRPGLAGTGWVLHWTEIFPGSYQVGERVLAVDIGTVANRYNGEVFTCHTAHLPGVAVNDEPGHGTAWEQYWNFGTGSQKISVWVTNKEYFQGAKVRINKTVYECIRTHVSAQPGITAGGGGRFGVNVVYGNKPAVSRGWARYWRISAADSDLSGITLAMHATEPVFTAEDVGTIWQLEIGTGGVVEYIAIPDDKGERSSSENNPLFIQGGYTVTTVWDTNDAMVGTLTIEESLNGVTWSVVRQFTQTSKKEGNILYNGDAPATGAWYRISAVADADSTAPKRIKLEAVSSVYRLPFKITKWEEPTKVEGNFIMPGNQLPPATVIGVSTSIFRKPAFSGKNGFPRTVAFHDSRLWWGGTRTHPTRMWGSHTEDYYIYLGGSLDTDGLDLTLATVEANAIQWMTGFNRSLVVGTSGDEWTVDSGDTDSGLTPTNLRARRRTRYGSNGLPPQVTGDALLWIRRGGGRLHEFAYMYERDSFGAPDLTLLAEHMLHLGDVKQTAFVSCPDPVLWVVNENYLLGLSYNREHNVTAWHKHKAAGAFFTSVASIYGEHAVDEVWFVMRRGTVHTLERFDPRTLAHYHGGRIEGSFVPVEEACFVDGAVVAEGTLVSSGTANKFGGLKDLRRLTLGTGITFKGHREGSNLDLITPEDIDANGEITLGGNMGAPPPRIVIGCSDVEATMQSMNLEVLLDTGTSQGRNWRLIRVVPEVWRCRAFRLTSGAAEREVFLWGDTTRVLDEIHFSGSFEKQLTWGVKSHNAYPCNLLGVVLKFEVTGG